MHFPSLADLVVEKSGFSGNLGMILGSGLSSISNELTNTIEIPYQDLNGIDIKTLGKGNTKFGYYPNNGPSDGFY